MNGKNRSREKETERDRERERMKEVYSLIKEVKSKVQVYQSMKMERRRGHSMMK